MNKEVLKAFEEFQEGALLITAREKHLSAVYVLDYDFKKKKNIIKKFAHTIGVVETDYTLSTFEKYLKDITTDKKERCKLKTVWLKNYDKL